MRAAPSFELTTSLSVPERSLLTSLVALTTGALAAWLGSLVSADAGPTALPAWVWPVAVAVSTGAGGWIGWIVAKPRAYTLRWHQGRWTCVDAQSGKEHEAIVEPRIDLGGWLLLALRLPDGVTRWATAGRRRAGASWHPLRATLFAPARHSIEPSAGESTPT